MEGNTPVLSSTLFLDRIGEVAVALHPDRLSWKHIDEGSNTSSCLCLKFQSKPETEIRFSDVYAVELLSCGLIHDPTWSAGNFLQNSANEMHRFTVHGFIRQQEHSLPWVLLEYTFGHKDLKICLAWVEQLKASIKNGVRRPKSLWVIVHPLCGKGNGPKTWERVAPIFSRAEVQTKVTVTQRAGHAYDMIASTSDKELRSFDGIVTVGGDGLFNEVLNGLLASRHKAPYPPTPNDFSIVRYDDQSQKHGNNDTSNSRSLFNDASDMLPESSYTNEDNEPLLATSKAAISKFTSNIGLCQSDQLPSVDFPNDWFGLGMIPAGSTDAIVLSTTGLRDPVTSALQIIQGRKMLLDIAQVVRWKTSPSSTDLPSVRYAASFAGYGFYGDVIQESEKYRWMGPARYDYAGTMVFLKHRSYEAEIAFLEVEKDPVPRSLSNAGIGMRPSKISRKNSDRQICRTNCAICSETTKSVQHSAGGTITATNNYSEKSKWLRSKGRFLSIGAAIMSCRNERAPDGLVADAHLADGFLHLILIKDCPRPFYLWHLTQLTKRGSDPLKFKFIEHHKTSAFTFVSSHDESVWNLDGEIFQACQVSVQVCHGLINLFASGPVV
ncbi:ceramide kinase isoform X1 [Typha latifolia]|uniref:ceramide kinase isoform X1 n=1 Tax=Typha latifolia TaxID=4733 RepID=UPI003C2BD26E